MRRLFLSLAPLFLAPALALQTASAAEITGAASPIGEKFCGPSGEADTSLLRCPGPAGVDAYIHEDGGRSSVSLGDPVEGYVSLGERNRLGSTMEWRSSDGRPFAGIVRFRLAGAEDGDGDILAVVKVAEGGRAGCLAAMVDATVNPNPEGRDLARRTADEVAPSFVCGADEPRFYGVSSDWARDAVLPHLAGAQ